MVAATNFYTVQGWMITELGLKGNELAAYAIIYGFSQDGRSEFSGSLSYLMRWIGCSRPTAVKILASLVSKGLIAKRAPADGMTPNSYTAMPLEMVLGGSKETLPGVVKNLNGGSKETLPGVVKNLPGGSKETLPNNYINNNSNNYLDNYEEKKKVNKKEKTPTPTPEKFPHGEFAHVMLTTEELAKLQAKYPDTWEHWIDTLDIYLEKIGPKARGKYHSHYATILTWARKEEKEAQDRQQQPARPAAAPAYQKQTKAQELDEFYSMAAAWAEGGANNGRQGAL